MSNVVIFVDPAQKGWKGEVDYRADLPDPSLHTGEIWLVRNDSGIWPFKKKAGFYLSTGGTWKYLGVLTLGSLADVDTTGIVDGQSIVYSGGGFIPETLALASHNHDSIYLKQDGTTFVSSNWDVDGQGTLFIDRVNKRVGIQTTTPAYTLDVAGDVKADKYLMTNQFSWNINALASNTKVDSRPLMFGQWADAFQFAQIISVEYFDDTSQSWVTWPGANMTPLFDGNPNTRVIIDYTHRKFRIVIYTKDWLQLGVVHIYREWSSGGTKAYTFSIERSADGATFTQVASASFDAGQYFDNVAINGHTSDRYWRLTFDISFANTTDIMPFIWIRGFTARLSYGTYFGLPITWDYNKNIGIDTPTPTAKLDVNGDIKAYGATIQPTTDGDALVVRSSAGKQVLRANTSSIKVTIGDNAPEDGTLTVNGSFVVQASDGVGSDWFSVGKVGPGVVAFNLGGGNTRIATYSNLARLTVGPLSASSKAAAFHGYAGGSNIFEIWSTPNAGGGDIMTVKQTGEIGFGKMDPIARVDIAGEIGLSEITPPSAPAANSLFVYAADDGTGLTELRAAFNTGDHLVLGVQGLTVPTYTVSNVTVTRTLDPTTATLSDVANVLATLIQDLQARRILKPYA